MREANYQGELLRDSLLRPRVQGQLAAQSKASVERLAARAIRDARQRLHADRGRSEARPEVSVELAEGLWYPDSATGRPREGWEDWIQSRSQVEGRPEVVGRAQAGDSRSQEARRTDTCIRERSALVQGVSGQEEWAVEGRHHARSAVVPFKSRMGRSGQVSVEAR